MQHHTVFRWLLALPLCAGCSFGGPPSIEDDQQIPYDPPGVGTTYAPYEDLLKPPAEARAGILLPGDVVQITVHGHPEYSTRAPITEDGIVPMLDIGDVLLKGLTLANARRTIRQELERTHLRSAPTSILVVERAPRKVFVLGAVKKPGAYDFPVDTELTLLRAIAFAGDLRDEAERDGILLLRRDASNRGRLYRLSYSAIADEGRIGGDIRLIPGDTLLVPDRGKVTVLGAVNSAGVFPIPARGMTLTEAIALARGTTRFAAHNGTIVKRPRAGRDPFSVRVPLGEILAGRFKNNPVLRAGDVVFVPESIF